MFGFGYKKRALAAEAKVKALEADVAYEREKATRYERWWREMVSVGSPELKASLAGHYIHPRRPEPQRLAPERTQPAAAMAVTSASSYAGGGFDMTSALLGGLAGYAVGSNPHHSAPSAPDTADTSSSISSGGGGDYGGGGATSSWDSSSSSSSSDSSSSYDSGSCSSSSYSSD